MIANPLCTIVKPYYFFLTCLVILLSRNAIAQSSEIELQVVPSLTNLRGNSFAEEISDPTFHISAGVGYNYVFRNEFLIKAALVYDSKGADGNANYPVFDEWNDVVGTQLVEGRNDYQYIVVPVQVGRRFGNKIKVEAAVGAYTGFLIQNVFEFWGPGDPAFYVKGKYSKHFSEIDFGISGSVSVYVPLRERLSLKLGVQDNLGLADISRDYPNIGSPVKHHSVGMQAGLCLRFNSHEQ